MRTPMAVVLAAGKGTRLAKEEAETPDLPKVLVPVRGRPMIDFVLDALQRAGVHRMVVVVGYRSDLVREHLGDRPGIEFVEQAQQLGTGHAVLMCREAIQEHDGPVVVLAGDSPLTQSDSLQSLLDDFERERPACLLGTLHKDDPTDLGRIVRDAAGEFLGIVEEKDASPAQREITEVNMSTYVFEPDALLRSLGQIKPTNRQKELYITDCPGILKAEGCTVRALPVLKQCEAFSVNTWEDLALVESEMARLGL